MNGLSIILMAVGAVSALVFAAGDMSTSVMHQVLYGASLTLIAGGAALRRKALSTDGLSGSSQAKTDLALKSLKTLQDSLAKIGDTDSLKDLSQFHQRLLVATQLPMRDFLNSRQDLLEALGFGLFADLMIRFARAERVINRALSASADGHFDEAHSSLLLAQQRVEECLAHWKD